MLDKHYPLVHVVRALFPKARSRFVVAAMTNLGGQVANRSYDHVLSFGAMAMYLLKSEMVMTLKEAVSSVGGVYSLKLAVQRSDVSLETYSHCNQSLRCPE